MIKRTTIEIDQDLLRRAKQALDAETTRATVEMSLRLAAESAENAHSERAALQRSYLRSLSGRADLKVLNSEAMWQ